MSSAGKHREERLLASTTMMTMTMMMMTMMTTMMTTTMMTMMTMMTTMTTTMTTMTTTTTMMTTTTTAAVPAAKAAAPNKLVGHLTHHSESEFRAGNWCGVLRKLPGGGIGTGHDLSEKEFTRFAGAWIDRERSHGTGGDSMQRVDAGRMHLSVHL
jgi:hypothetical protein